MTYRRVTFGRIKKWSKTTAVAGIPILIIFYFLFMIGDINIVGYSGDMVCGYDVPCIAQINFTMNKDYIYIYPNSSWYFYSDYPIHNISFQVRDKRTKSGWRTIDLSKPSPYCQRTGCKYAYRFYKSKGLWEIRFVAYIDWDKIKKDKIKWGFGPIDPYWYRINNLKRVLSEDWENGSIDTDYWETWSSSQYGRIVVTSTNGTPHNGSYHLLMDVTKTGTENRNALITKRDFSGANKIELSFWVIGYGEESDECPDSWTGYDPGVSRGDCVAFTCDNYTWYKAVDLAPAPTSYTEYTYDFSTNPHWCSEINSSFRIRFGQDDNYPYSSDGIAYDDINITIYYDYGVFLDDYRSSKSYELGSIANISCYSGTYCCLSINMSGWNNFTCFYPNGSYDFVTFSRLDKFSNNKMYDEANDNHVLSFDINSKVLIDNVTLNITGYASGGNYSKDLFIKSTLDNRGIYYYVSGYLNGNNYAYINYTTNGNTSEELVFQTATVPTYKSYVRYIRLPSHYIDLKSTKIGLEGVQHPSYIFISDEYSCSGTTNPDYSSCSHSNDGDGNTKVCAWTSGSGNLTIYKNYSIDYSGTAPDLNITVWSEGSNVYVYCWDYSGSSWKFIVKSPSDTDTNDIPSNCEHDTGSSVETRLKIDLEDNGGGSDGNCLTETEIITDEIYTERVYVDVGLDGIIDWNESGVFNYYTTIENNTAVENYIKDNCQNSAYCDVPIRFATTKFGSVIYKNINFSYNYIATFNNSMINSFVSNDFNKLFAGTHESFKYSSYNSIYSDSNDIISFAHTDNSYLRYASWNGSGFDFVYLINSSDGFEIGQYGRQPLVLSKDWNGNPFIIFSASAPESAYWWEYYDGTSWNRQMISNSGLTDTKTPSFHVIVNDSKQEILFSATNYTDVIYYNYSYNQWHNESIISGVQADIWHATDIDYENNKVYVAMCYKNTTTNNYDISIAEKLSSGWDITRIDNLSSSCNSLSLDVEGDYKLISLRSGSSSFEYFYNGSWNKNQIPISSILLNSFLYNGDRYYFYETSNANVKYYHNGQTTTIGEYQSNRLNLYASNGVAYIFYSYRPNGVGNYFEIQRFDKKEIRNIPIYLYSNSWKPTGFNITVDYNGTANYLISSIVDGSDGNNIEMNVYFSNFTIDYNSNIKSLVFVPDSNSSKNVTPYGQSPTTPAINVTENSYSKPMKIGIKWNNTNSCLILRVSNTSDWSDSITVTNNYKTILTFDSLYESRGLWFWLDLNDCSAGIVIPRISYKSCCIGCEECW